MNTKKFRTKTSFIPRDNKVVDGTWEIALDIGYSAVKLISPNIVAAFPSYAKRVEPEYQYVGEAPESSLVYRDLKTDETWVVGEIAQNLLSHNDTSDSEAALYGRDRYFNQMFHVITEVGLGLGLQNNMYGEPRASKIVVQTGLPERYMSDQDMLRDSLSGTHEFALKIGGQDWVTYSFELDKNDIYVMSQPKGTLFSVLTNNDGSFVPDAGKLLKSSVLIFDPGFGTFDIFAVESGTVNGPGETFSDLGMKRILQETSKMIRDKYGVNLTVPAMQKNLETGYVRKFDKRTLTSKDYNFGDLLQTACEKVCREAIERLNASYDLSNFEYVIITGGTGAAWFSQIEAAFKNLTFLKILRGNQNDTLDFIYSNVRGYYNYRLNKLLSGNSQKNGG